ncbi:MAG TPA: YbaB/EbfC family nucleoid-associated protein [Pseudonocardia sp.]|nr:YbaB/EbfC family nucleoid-associated protein [Pseudonocardia sp.]
MTAPREELDRLVAEFTEQHQQLLAAQQRLSEVSATVTSPRNVLTVTVGAAGQLEEVRFNNRDYRNMGPEDLGELVKRTIEDARAALADQIHETMQPLSGGSTTLDEMLKGSFDWQQIFPAGMFDAIDGTAEEIEGKRG